MWEDEVLPGPYYLMDRVQYLQQLFTTVRVALIGRAKKRSTRPQMACFHQKRAKKGLHALRCRVFHRKYR